MQTQTGFTLIELMVLLAVVAILASIAVPNFSATIKSDRDISQINTLLTGLALARSEAVKSDGNIIICATTGGTTCAPASSTWSSGFMVQYATPPPGASTTIRVFPALGGSNSLTSSTGGSITYQSNGMTNLAGPATFTLCDSRGANYARALDVLVSGVTQTSATLGKDVGGGALSCP